MIFSLVDECFFRLDIIIRMWKFHLSKLHQNIFKSPTRFQITRNHLSLQKRKINVLTCHAVKHISYSVISSHPDDGVGVLTEAILGDDCLLPFGTMICSAGLTHRWLGLWMVWFVSREGKRRTCPSERQATSVSRVTGSIRTQCGLWGLLISRVHPLPR